MIHAGLDDQIEVFDQGLGAFYWVRYEVGSFCVVYDNEGREYVCKRSLGAWKMLRPKNIVDRLAASER